MRLISWTLQSGSEPYLPLDNTVDADETKQWAIYTVKKSDLKSWKAVKSQ
jgi:hypothetical protein